MADIKRNAARCVVEYFTCTVLTLNRYFTFYLQCSLTNNENFTSLSCNWILNKITIHKNILKFINSKWYCRNHYQILDSFSGCTVEGILIWFIGVSMHTVLSNQGA